MHQTLILDNFNQDIKQEIKIDFNITIKPKFSKFNKPKNQMKIESIKAKITEKAIKLEIIQPTGISILDALYWLG